MRRRVFLACVVSVLAVGGACGPADAKGIDLPIKSVLGAASDSALDKLSQPGAFYADEAVRILLPGPLKKAGKVLALADKAGLTGDLTRTINDAAGKAAGEAKPIFRTAIDDMTLADGITMATKDRGATDYLQKSAGSALRGKLRPLIESALGSTGAYTQLSKVGSAGSLLSSVGLDRNGLTDSVTDQAMKGIFAYIGNEEAKIRANPLKAGKKLLKGLAN
jgi:hypothetical protein